MVSRNNFRWWAPRLVAKKKLGEGAKGRKWKYEKICWRKTVRISRIPFHPIQKKNEEPFLLLFYALGFLFGLYEAVVNQFFPNNSPMCEFAVFPSSEHCYLLWSLHQKIALINWQTWSVVVGDGVLWQWLCDWPDQIIKEWLFERGMDCIH